MQHSKAISVIIMYAYVGGKQKGTCLLNYMRLINICAIVIFFLVTNRYTVRVTNILTPEPFSLQLLMELLNFSAASFSTLTPFSSEEKIPLNIVKAAILEQLDLTKDSLAFIKVNALAILRELF